MCFNKNLKKQMATLQESVARLQKSIETNELTRLREIQKQHMESEKSLVNVKLKVKNIKYLKQDRQLVVTYEQPIIVLNIDDTGEPEPNKEFISINKLNLVSMDDMLRIQNELNKIKQNN